MRVLSPPSPCLSRCLSPPRPPPPPRGAGRAVEDAHGPRALGRPHRLRLRERHLDVPPRRQRRLARHLRPRPEDASGLQPRRLAPRLQRRAGRQPRRLRRPGRGRRAEAPHVAPGPRRRAGLHARRQVRPLHLAARRRQQPARAALHGARRGRPRDAPPDPVRDRAAYSPDGKTIAYNPNPRRTCSGSATAAALSRRYGSSTSPRTRSTASRNPRRAATTWTRCGSAGRSSSLRPRRRVQPLRVRRRSRRPSRA